MREPSVVGLIPARSGSERIPGKNVRRLAGHPLLAYAIASALDSRVFQQVVVSTDSEEIAETARAYGADTPFLRPPGYAESDSPDIQWVRHALDWFRGSGRDPDCFSILRPTSPFRRSSTIRLAWEAFCREEGIDSLRAVELCSQHPAKMWVRRNDRLLPLMPWGPEDRPWHSSQYKTLPEVWVQNASLEIAWCRVVYEQGTIAGNTIMPWMTRGHEGMDLNSPYDWLVAEAMISSGTATLPDVAELSSS